MSGFVATGTPAAPLNLANDGFWPTIDLTALRAAMRLDASVTNARLEASASIAMLEANRELSHYRATCIAAGYSQLHQVPAARIGDVSELQHFYQRLIYCNTAAELTERYRSYDSTNSGNQRNDEETSAIDDLRRDARFALRAILGVSRITVELL